MQRCRNRRVPLGFTLVEIMIVLVVIALLAVVALPSYLDSVRKGRRSDAVTALTVVQQGQERWRATNLAYTGTLSDLCTGCENSAGGFYTVSIEAADANGYVLAALPVSGLSQANDTRCTRMRLQLVGGNVFYGGCNGCAAPIAPAKVSDPDRCWSK